jgi:hypothetical protein
MNSKINPTSLKDRVMSKPIFQTLSQLGLVVALIGAFSSQVMADQIRADYLGYQGGSFDTSALNGGGGKISFDRQALTSGTEFSGTLNSNGGPTNLGGSDDVFYGFCIEPTEWLVSQHTYNVVDLTDAPNNGVSGRMSAENAKDLSLLFGAVLPDFSATISNQTAIALQIAVWEIANEGSVNGDSYDVTGGNFVVNNSYSDPSALGIAQGWLEQIMADEFQVQAQGLVALVDTDSRDQRGQDFVVQVAAVPLPGAVWLFGSAILGAGIVSRRKKARRLG